ncbi:MAG: hypothetical protein KTR30_27110 [Saprospiraceae bacterium]|nr:hypothetical protein [Saprospiraceae bacterium]
MFKILIQFQLLLGLLTQAVPGFSQHQYEHPSQDLNYDQIYAYGLDANISPALDLLKQFSGDLSVEDQTFKQRFLDRFVDGKEIDIEASVPHQKIGELLTIFRGYWRMSMLDTTQNFDGHLASQVGPFLKKNYPPVRDIAIQRDSIGYYLSRYIHSQGFFTTKEVGKTGRLVDLPIWQTQLDTIYTFELHKDKLQVPVVMMKDFLSLGWLQYATLGRHYPGGWAREDTLFCVRSAYDLDSEQFQVSYLAHEGRHLEDYQRYPNLKSYDLEYRAKLTELSLARESLFDLISFFIKQSNKESKNPHQFANYYLIRDLSRSLFKKEFEADLEQWKAVRPDKINRTAFKLLKKNAKQLRKRGKSVKSLLKPESI